MASTKGLGELGFIDRFAQEVIHPALQGDAPIPLQAMGGDGHDPGAVRRQLLAPDPAGGRKTVEPRHAQIHQDQVGVQAALPLHRFDSVDDELCLIAQSPQHQFTHSAVDDVVFRHQDPQGVKSGEVFTRDDLALAIRLDSPGPILFSQVRLGWMGRRFRLWKLRSMVVNAEALRGTVPNEASGAFFKNKNDPRITRVGRFLRRTSLDELPQFWNVLIGDMSLIGTRPPTPDEVDRYAVPSWQRLDVRPGLSGEWQVNGRSKVLDFEDVIRMDLRYQENWSLGYDLQLIMRTFTTIFSKRSGAA